MSIEHVTQLKTRLENLLKTAQNPKILWEEMEIIAKQAFQIQAESDDALKRLETAEQDIQRLNTLFDLREEIWDLADRMACLELEVKEKTLTPANKGKQAKHTCCHHQNTSDSSHCQHSHKSCCDDHDPSDCCCHKH